MGHLARIACLGLLLWIGFVAPAEAEAVDVSSVTAAACTPAAQCCKICDKGQACGNSCISRAKVCHKGRGCACNLSEVCTEK